jgi:chromosome segregation ATPase
MPSDREHDLSEDAFRKVGAALSQLREAAAAPPDPPESWWKRTFGRPPPSFRQSDFNGALVEALEEAVTALRETAATGKMQLEQIQRDLAELRSLSASLREHTAGIDKLRQEVSTLQERAAAAEAQLAQAGREPGERIDQLSAGLNNLGSELRERIQHLLDEQRVSIRQVSLKASEEAVLADRARRATELRLEEIARRRPEPPA